MMIGCIFEKVDVYLSQLAYREGGNCTDASLAIQRFAITWKYADCEVVPLYIMDFIKAYDSVN